ncbi:response regulator transcription factor [Paenibacillus medicaginis]|uniref:Response regulator n=1 Tax=Paenibacillus medicaginis TaxID=1470560 RepID=A0ABV5C8G0_9BACL
MIDVLIVDDDKLVRKGLISAMPWDSFGMRVIGEAANGEKALEFLQHNRVDLLMTDVAMPVMSGIELIRIVRKRYPDIAIAVLTLHQDFEYIQEALRLGAVDYIAKVQLEKERFEQVLGRIHELILNQRRRPSNEPDAVYKQRDFFYDSDEFEPNSIEKFAQELQAEQPGLSEREVEAVKEALHAFRWVHDDSYFAELCNQLRGLRLPAPKLMQLLYGVIVDWNRLFKALTQTGITLPDTFSCWREVVEWMGGFREKAIMLSGHQQVSKEVSASIMSAVKIVHDELDFPLFAVDVAKRVNLSRSYFNQCFKAIVGYSFNEYLRKVRIDKAREYLAQTAKPIVWIAEHTGYADEKYFSRTFREQTGMLPSEYRQQHKSR